MEMKIGSYVQRWLAKIGRYKYAAFVLLFGIILMCLPRTHTEKPQEETAVQVIPAADFELELERLLSQIEGAGRVEVLLSLQSDMQYSYHQDMQSNTTSDTVQMQTQTVFYREDGNELPVLAGTEYPVYRGAVIVCEGADSASVQLHMIRAVSNLTGLGTDHITVIKMNTK